MKLNQVMKLQKDTPTKKGNSQRYKNLYQCQRISMETKFKFQAFLVTYQKRGKSVCKSYPVGTFRIQAKGCFL